MIAHIFQAMGTTIEAWSEDDTSSSLETWFEEVEAVCSRFRPDSELSRINRDTSPRMRPSPMLSEVLETAVRARSMTGGLVDAGLGRAVAAWGYDRTFPEVEALDSEPSPSNPCEWEYRDGILTRSPSVSLDLGGVAKGWACDRAVESGLAEVVSAGGDLRSTHPGTTVTVIDPSGAEDVHVRVGVGALATSSTTRRRWKVAGRDVCHIVDPRTMRPVDTPVTAATVLAETASDAEAGAKAVLLHGEDGLAWAADQEWIRSAIVFWHDGSVFATPGCEVAA